MTVTERVAYLKGLFEGLEIDTDKKEGKILKGVLEVLDDLALTVSDLEDENAALTDEIEEIYEELESIEDDLYEDEDEDKCDCDECDDDDDYEFDPNEELYQVVCPTCEEEIFVDEGTLAEGSIKCPACGEELEFDMSAIEGECDCGDDGCDCGCGHDHH